MGVDGKGFASGERERARASLGERTEKEGGREREGAGREGVVLGGRAREETMESKRNRKRGVGGRERGRKEGEREGRTKEDATSAHTRLSCARAPFPRRILPVLSSSLLVCLPLPLSLVSVGGRLGYWACLTSGSRCAGPGRQAAEAAPHQVSSPASWARRRPLSAPPPPHYPAEPPLLQACAWLPDRLRAS